MQLNWYKKMSYLNLAWFCGGALKERKHLSAFQISFITGKNEKYNVLRPL
jgi:hypothetical protein